jgi:methylated-DNA-[protein]-cysteine S-methyltransferase
MACTRRSCFMERLGAFHDKLRMNLSYKLANSPVGVLKLVASEKGLVAILWENDDPWRVRLGDLVEELHHPLLVRTEKELSEYFGRKRLTFSIPLEMRGTHFQRQVWEFLLGIPFGETCSYGDIAKRLGDPAASRAVGEANRRNPISIVVPCHRVVGGAGNLTGFAGGLEAKRYLLKLETTNDEMMGPHCPPSRAYTNEH